MTPGARARATQFAAAGDVSDAEASGFVTVQAEVTARQCADDELAELAWLTHADTAQLVSKEHVFEPIPGREVGIVAAEAHGLEHHVRHHGKPRAAVGADGSLEEVIHGASVGLTIIVNFIGEEEARVVDDAEVLRPRECLAVAHRLHHELGDEVRHALGQATGVRQMQHVPHEAVHDPMAQLVPDGGVVPRHVLFARGVGGEVNGVIGVVGVVAHGDVWVEEKGMEGPLREVRVREAHGPQRIEQLVHGEIHLQLVEAIVDVGGRVIVRKPTCRAVPGFIRGGQGASGASARGHHLPGGFAGVRDAFAPVGAQLRGITRREIKACEAFWCRGVEVHRDVTAHEGHTAGFEAVFTGGQSCAKGGTLAPQPAHGPVALGTAQVGFAQDRVELAFQITAPPEARVGVSGGGLHAVLHVLQLARDAIQDLARALH